MAAIGGVNNVPAFTAFVKTKQTQIPDRSPDRSEMFQCECQFSTSMSDPEATTDPLSKN